MAAFPMPCIAVPCRWAWTQAPELTTQAPGPVLALAPTSYTLTKCRSCRLERRKTATIFYPYTNRNAPPQRWKASVAVSGQDSPPRKWEKRAAKV